MTPATGRARICHLGGFVLAGVLALATDLAVLRLLTDGAALDPILARPASIAVAMIVSWWVNRTVTFAVATVPRLAEFVRFAGVSWVAQAINYVAFSAILYASPATGQEWAVIAASLLSMLVSYTGFRFGVFRRDGRGTSE